MTRWKPDTCGCEIEFNGHDANGRQNVTSIVKCSAHSQDQNAHDSVLDENQSKNKAIGSVIENHPEMKGRESEILFAFDSKRDIVLNLPTDMKHIKDGMNIRVDKKFSKKVTFE